MFNLKRTSILLGIVLHFVNCSHSESKYEQIADKIAPLYTAKSTPKEGEWLFDHHEKKQSFSEYLHSKPTRIDSIRKKIYVTRIGNFSDKQSEIIDKTSDYFKAFYGLEVKEIDLPKAIDIQKNARINRHNQEKQLFTPHLLNDVLYPNLPKDAAVLIALTSFDLYPKDDWNFVFGQASMKNRVGVWSMNRFGNPDLDQKTYDLCFFRTLKTATHEIGHIFSIRHCVSYECCMNGTNSATENISRPTYFCHECLTKLCWNLTHDVKKKLSDTKHFWRRQKRKELENFYEKNIKLL